MKRLKQAFINGQTVGFIAILATIIIEAPQHGEVPMYIIALALVSIFGAVAGICAVAMDEIQSRG